MCISMKIKLIIFCACITYCTLLFVQKLLTIYTLFSAIFLVIFLTSIEIFLSNYFLLVMFLLQVINSDFYLLSSLKSISLFSACLPTSNRIYSNWVYFEENMSERQFGMFYCMHTTLENSLGFL